MDKIDRPRKELIQDHISLKYGFNIARETNREVFKEQAHEHINKWREEHNQKPFDFSNKKGQAEAEAQINGYLSELIKSGLIEKREDISTTLKELGLKIEKENGLDIKKDFAYTTVSNESGKMRIKGEIHHDRFYINNAKDRTAQIENNRRIIEEREPNQERAERVRKELNKANEKRFRTVTKLFSKSRARAEAEHKQTLKMGELESLNSSKHNKHNNRVIDRNTNTKTANEVGAVHREQKLYSNRQKQLSTIQPKRVDLRPTKETLLLQNKLKDNRNARYYEQIIRRVAESRETQQSVIREAERERKIEYTNFERVQSKIRDFGEKISGAFDRVREKALNTINEMKEKLNFGKLKKDDNLEKLIKNMEARTQDKSVSSSFNKTKEVQNERKRGLFEKLQEVDKERELEAPVKKRSYGRSR